MARPADGRRGHRHRRLAGRGLAGSAGSTFLLTLIVGAILVAIVPAYTERTMDVVRDDPVNSFLYGLVSLLIGVAGFGVAVYDALD